MRSDTELLDRLTHGPRPWRLPLAVLTALGVLLPIGFLYLVAYIDWPARPAPLPDEIARAAGGDPGLAGTAYVFDSWGLAPEICLYDQRLWRVEASPELLPALVRSCEAKELRSAAEVPAGFWRQRPYWWRPNRNGAARFFMSPDFPPDERCPDEGCHYLLMYDEGERVLYVWVKEYF